MAYDALHSKGFVYRDMKPANVLIKDNGYCVLIDFGLAAKVCRQNQPPPLPPVPHPRRTAAGPCSCPCKASTCCDPAEQAVTRA